MSEEQKKAKLQFKNFVVPEFYAKKIVEKSDIKDKFKLEPQAVISRADNQFHIHMKLGLISLESEMEIDMIGIGIFYYEVEDEQELLNYMALNGPAIVFPYLRSFISTYTSNSGFDTITIPTLNLARFKTSIIENFIDLDNE